MKNLLPKLSPQRLEEIDKYRSYDLRPKKFLKDKLLLRDVLLFHSSPITRHEAAFTIGHFGLFELMPFLMYVIKNDESVIVQHEACEALGEMKGCAAKEAYNFLNKVVNDKKKRYHSDVIITIKEAMENLYKSF
ncbi:HEAT repeat domain-containing protein [Candidatus Azambacteria bacterium]|nr:HEAT repeat domain-containing protein [Candidatus Azambacteria bacterium]